MPESYAVPLFQSSCRVSLHLAGLSSNECEGRTKIILNREIEWRKSKAIFDKDFVVADSSEITSLSQLKIVQTAVEKPLDTYSAMADLFALKPLSMVIDLQALDYRQTRKVADLVIDALDSARREDIWV